MRELFCRYMVVEKGMELYSDPAMAPVANRRRRDSLITTASAHNSHFYLLLVRSKYDDSPTPANHGGCRLTCSCYRSSFILLKTISTFELIIKSNRPSFKKLIYLPFFHILFVHSRQPIKKFKQQQSWRQNSKSAIR